MIATDSEASDTPARSLIGFGWFLIVTAAVGFTCSMVLTIEKIHMLEDPETALNCDINPFISCGGVFIHPESEIFGFPNPLLGIAGFAVMITIGVLLASRAALPRWFWGGLQVGVLFGISIVTWLQYQSIYDIGILCPYCMVVWSMMIPMFVVTTSEVAREYAPGSPITRFLVDWRVLIVSLWIIAVCSAIWFEFGSDLWA